MNRAAGWVQLLALDGDEVLGRGHLLVSENPSVEGRPEWDGQVQALRLEPPMFVPFPGRYRLRFEHYPDEQVVRVDGVRAGAGLAAVSCADDCELPLSLRRLGGE